MKKMLILGVAAIAGLVMTGCTSLNTNSAAADSKAVVVPAVFEQEVELKKDKAEGEATVHVLFGIFSWGVSEFADRAELGRPNAGMSLIPDPACEAKAGAVFNACKASESDLLVGSKYEVNVTNYIVYKQYNCKVSGYPAIEKGLKQIPAKHAPIEAVKAF